ncbi:hypothetical protein B6S12_01270 [Helicobacter valdiviensis]|uniref:Uncharacterized protein n=1 Tax=Helicobacter valdiviensis TaxID=1458358 RepID=A0A2W6MX88_9HELI|nr:hypothetical protein [Helicobacter valdiviensis]PZT48952.1 hypothetical protein B6S12_01270 [Helicobacter valdiviensis]
MYYLDFYFFVWVLMIIALMPFALLSGVAIIMQNIQAYLEEQRKKENLLKNIQHLISVLKGTPSDDEVQEVLEAFKKYFNPFTNHKKESKEYQERMDFISALAWCASVDIDSIVRYREEFVKLNPNYKKEIETTIGSALKNRETNEKKKK